VQYVSTLVGCLALAAWLYRWYRRTAPQQTSGQLSPWLRYVVYASAAGLAAVGAVVEFARADRTFGGETVVRSVLTGLVSGGLVVLVVYVGLWHLQRLRRRSYVS
jgi:hypothetical protein